MENKAKIYDDLRDLYSEKEKKYDSFSIGSQIEKIVNLLIQEIVHPYKLELDVRFGKDVFDGRIKIGQGRAVIIEIFSGNLSEFRYQRLSRVVESTYSRSRIYYLIIARSFQSKDEKRIVELSKLTEAKKNVYLSFMDHEALISLHKFCSIINDTSSYEELKKVKGFFLQNILKNNSIVQEGAFENALTSARQQYSLSIGTLKASRMKLPIIKYEEYELKLRNLEELLEMALNEIRRLRNELAK